MYVKWQLPKDVSAWINAIVAIVGAIGSAGGVSFALKYRVSKRTLNAVIDQSRQLINQESNETHNSHNTTHTTTNNHSISSDPAQTVALRDVLMQMQKLEGMVVAQHATPADVKLLNDFLDRARTNRVVELENQLAKVVGIFDRLRDAMSQAAAECETARRESDSARRA